MRTHVQHLCSSSSYQLRQLRSIRSSLSETSCSALVHAFVTSRLDYCNSLLTGIGDGLIAQLQSVIRVAARLALRRRKFDPISADIRDRLHWLPIRSKIDFKLGLLVYKCLHGIAPLVEMLQSKSDVPALGHLVVARTLTKTLDHEASLFPAPHSGTRYLITSGITHCQFMSSNANSKRFYAFSTFNFNCICASFVVPFLHLLLLKRFRDCLRSEISFLHYTTLQMS